MIIPPSLGKRAINNSPGSWMSQSECCPFFQVFQDVPSLCLTFSYAQHTCLEAASWEVGAGGSDLFPVETAHVQGPSKFLAGEYREMASWVEECPYWQLLTQTFLWTIRKVTKPYWLLNWDSWNTAPCPTMEGLRKSPQCSCGRMGKHQSPHWTFPVVCWTTQKKFVNSLCVWSSGGINQAKSQTAGYTSLFSSCCVRLDPELNHNGFSQSLVRTEPQSHWVASAAFDLLLIA